MARLPDWITPMAATLTQDRFVDPAWIFERKHDGIRLLAFKDGDDVRLFSRNHLPQHLPAIANAVAALPVANAILDGEVQWDGSAYHVFDVLWLEDRDLMPRPLDERHALLEGLPLRAPLTRVDWIDHPEPWRLAAASGWEGVIAKRRDSVYEPRRSPQWLKMKIEVKQDFLIGGFTDPRGRRVGLGALLVGHFVGDDFVFAGKVGTGLDTKLLLDLRARCEALAVAQSPFARGTGFPRDAHWVRPAITAQVAFIEWTRHGKLRHPRLLSVRPDPAARS